VRGAQLAEHGALGNGILSRHRAYHGSTNAGARFSMPARTDSIWLGEYIRSIWLTLSAMSTSAGDISGVRLDKSLAPRTA